LDDLSRLVKNNTWVADDHLFVGEEPGDGFGAAVALSSDGTTLVMGAPENGEFGKSSGQIQVWQYVHKAAGAGANKWIQLGSNVGGTAGANLGSSVALSWHDDETKSGVLHVVGGTPGADFDGSVTKAGGFFNPPPCGTGQQHFGSALLGSISISDPGSSWFLINRVCHGFDCCWYNIKKRWGRAIWNQTPTLAT
jgi:hypothetical protein